MTDPNPNTQVGPEPEPRPETQLTAPSYTRHRREWWQDPLVRTWLFPPVMGAGLGVLYTFGLMTLLLVLGLLADHKLNLPDLKDLPKALYVYGQAGGYLGFVASFVIHLVKHPNGNLAKVLKGLWRVVYILTLLFAVLMSFGMLSGLVGSQLSRKL